MSTQSLRSSVKKGAIAIIGLMALAVTSAANAEVLLRAGQNNTRNLFGGASYIVDFNGTGVAGGTVFNFTTPAANTQLVVFFSAECGVEGATTKNVNVDIIIDPAGATGPEIIIPTDGSDILCSGNGTTTATDINFYIDGMTRVSLVGTYKVVPKGTHTIQVRLNGNLALSRLSNMSLVVMR
jgi:hypothetical protein